jgi:hypothetical protein
MEKGTAFSIEDIRILVASAIEDLSPAAVSVLMTEGSASPVAISSVENVASKIDNAPGASAQNYSDLPDFIGPKIQIVQPAWEQGLLLLFSGISVACVATGLVSVWRLRAFRRKMQIVA